MESTEMLFSFDAGISRKLYLVSVVCRLSCHPFINKIKNQFPSRSLMVALLTFAASEN